MMKVTICHSVKIRWCLCIPPTLYTVAALAVAALAVAVRVVAMRVVALRGVTLKQRRGWQYGDERPGGGQHSGGWC